jgi:hypothetical protein
VISIKTEKRELDHLRLPLVSFPANNFFASDANTMCQASLRSVSYAHRHWVKASTTSTKQVEKTSIKHRTLAFLAEEMVRLNEDKRAAQKEFLDWMATTLRISPDKERLT